MNRKELRKESHKLLDKILDMDSNKQIIEGNKWAKREIKNHGQNN